MKNILMKIIGFFSFSNFVFGMQEELIDSIAFMKRKSRKVAHAEDIQFDNKIGFSCPGVSENYITEIDSHTSSHPVRSTITSGTKKEFYLMLNQDL